ncbi:MAG: tetratricopeptide repeat protein, partial [Myxococcota bacterium]
ANLWIKRFANYNQATKPLERVVEIDPKHLESIRLLKEIYGKKRAWSSLYDVLHKEYELVSDDAERLSLLVDRAKIAGDRLHRHADAVALWREIARLAPETPGALDALERYAEREKDWPAVAEALELRVERAEDDRMRVKVLQKLGTVYGEHMRDASRAAGVWKRVLEMEPSNGRALRTLRETFIESADFEGLEALYSGVGDWEALVEVLGSAAERTEDSATKLRLSFRAAEIYEDELEAPQRAFRNYERVLSVDPNNVRAARALLPIYEKGEKWSRVVGLLAVILHTLDEEAADERLSILKRLRELTSAKLSDHQAAFSWAKEAYRLAPKDPDTSKVLEADALATGKFEALVEVYESRLQLARELSEQLDLRRRLATLTGERLGRVDAAIEQLNMILAADPSDSEAIDVLQRLYQAENRTRDLRDLWVHQLEHVSSADEERIQLLFALADLEERSLQEPESALLRLLRVLELRPDDLGALRAVDRLFVALQRWNELVEVVTRQLQLVERDDERIQLADRLAELRLERLEDPKGALEAWGSVLELNLSDSSAIQGLEQIQSQYEDLSLRTGYLLEPAYEASSSWHKLSEVLRHRVQCAVDEPTKQSLRLRLAELLGSRLGDVQGAYATLESAFLDDPRDSELWEKLHAAAGAADRNHELVAAYSVAIEDGGLSSEDSAALARRAAEVWDVALGVPSNAERFHRKVLSVDSLDMVAFQSLKELYTEQERWEELQVLYRSRIAETIDAELKLELLQQLCFLFEEILDDAVMAIPAYQEVLELNPDHLPARRALERLFRKTERYDDLALLLQRNLEEAHGQEAIDLTFELGDLYEKYLSEPEKAVDYYDAILTQSPTHMRAQEALERLIEIPEQRQRIARILEPLYEAQGGWRELARVLRVQLEDASDSVARVDLLLRIAEVYESREHDNAQAFEALSQALCCDPADSRSRQELARLAVLDRRNEDHAAVLERAVDASYGDAFLQSDLLLELAKLWDDRVQDHGRAALVYQRLIAIDDQNPDVVLPASRALERIHLAAGDFEALALDLKRQIYLEREQEVRAGLLLRLAELYESQLGQLDGAIQAHQERLQIDPLDQHSMRALEALYELTEQWKQLIDVLQIREASLPDEEEQRELARQVGSIYETRLKDVPGAIAAYNDVLVRFGSDRETLAALIRLYEQRGAWDDLREALRIDLELVQDVESRTELRFRMGELMREQLVDLEGAVEAYAEVLDIQPQHEGARLALEQLLDSSERSARVGAARTLVPLHEASERFEPLVRALCVMADVDDPMLQFQSLRRAAEVADVGLNDAQRAFELLGTSIRLALGDASLESLLLELERHASSSGRWKDYVSLLEEIAPDIFDGELQTQVLLRIAGTSAERLGDYEQARHYYTRVLENQPEHGPALDALERLHTEASDYPALLDILVRKTEIATDSELRVPLLVLQAQLCETQLEDIPAAIDAFEKVLNEAELPEAFEGLERLYERAERYLDLAQLLERKLEQGVGSPVEIQYKLGKISMEQLSDSFAALEYFRGAISARSDHQPSIDALELLMEDEDLRSSAAEILEPVFLAQMNWPKVTGALEARLSASVDVTLRKRLLRRLGEIFEDHLEDLEGARDQYARMFREDPTDSDVWETLGRMARVLDQWEHLAALYTEILESKVFGGEDSIQLAVMAGRLWDERLNNLDKADRCYSMALEFDPARTEVFAALESVRVRREAWPETLALYSDRIQVVDDDSDRASLHRRSAVVLEERLQDMEGAADAYRSVLEIDGSDVACWRALDRILGTLQRWPEQADHLWRRLELVEGTAEALELKCRLGQLFDDKLSDVDRAIDMYEEVLQVDPAHETALKALERLVLGEDHRLRITQILEPLYRSTGQWKKLVA